MGLFGFGKKNNEGGLMDAIRCDEKDFLIWKWRPAGQEANSTKKENAIRTGSSLNVRPGQAAIFLYPNTSGEYDVIIGPYNDIIKTDNMPVLANIIGAAYDGGTPFQAEVYFISLSEGMSLDFTIPFFSIFPSQPEYKMYELEVAVDGNLMFATAPSREEYRWQFDQAGRTDDFEQYRKAQLKDQLKGLFEKWDGSDTTIAELKKRMEGMVTAEVASRFANLPPEVFALDLNRLRKEWGQFMLANMFPQLRRSFGIWPVQLNITDIRFNQGAQGYLKLKRVTEDQSFRINLQNEENVLSQLATDAAVRNGMVVRQANIQMDHQEDMLGRMREEAQFAQRMQTESTAHRTNLASETAYLGAHTVNVQGSVMQTGMESMGQMGNMDFGSGGGMNPAGMMMGMGMASGMAGQMGQMMGNMGNAFNNQVAQASAPTPPPMPGQTPPAPPTPQAAAYFVLINNQQTGPCDMNAIRQMIGAGQMNAQTMVWANGMPQWAAAGTVPALAPLFQAPPTPPTPPMPGSVPPPPPTM